MMINLPVPALNIMNKFCVFIVCLLVIFFYFSSVSYADTYNLSNGDRPPCNTSWSVSGTTYTCTGNGRVTLASGDVLASNTTITISANDGFVLSNNIIGSLANNINLVSSYGAIQSGNTNTVYGSITSGSGVITLINTTVTGTITTGGNINLTGGSVTGKITSNSNTITTNGTNLSGGAQAQSGMNFTGGTLAGSFVMTSNNPITLNAVTMTSGSISGASTVTIQGGSLLGSSSSAITISSNSGAINVNNSTVYGNLTAPGYSTVRITNGGAVYGSCLPNSTPANACNNTSTQVDHYRISHSGIGVTCAAEAITIRAYNNLGNLVNPPTGTTILLTTSPAIGTWNGGNTVTFNGTTDTAIKYLRQTTAATLNINVSDGVKNELPAFDPHITFVNTALQFGLDSNFSSIDTQIAGVTNANFVLRAIRTDKSTGACVAQTTGNRSVSLAYECRNPVSCIDGQSLQLNGIDINANNNNASIGYNAVTLNFNTSGIANIPFYYSDVGLIRLHAQLSLDETNNDPAITLSGTSNDFVVKPHSLVVSAVTTASNINNPGTTSSGTGFVAAGEKFNVNLQSRNASGNPTPNFGREETPEINQLAIVEGALSYPASGSLTAITIGGAFTATSPAGTFVNPDIQWNQVGSLTIRPYLLDNDYLGAGDIPNKPASGVIGRFYPNMFDLMNTDAIVTCSGFLYMGMPFNVDSTTLGTQGLDFMLRALDKGGNPVTNYDLAKGYAVASIPFFLFNTEINFLSRLKNNSVAISAPIWINGVAAISEPNAQFSRVNTPDGPYSAVKLGIGVQDCLDKRQLSGANLTVDTTGACGALENNAYELAQFEVRYGRLRLDDAFGPETANLPVNFSTEYWLGNRFVRNLGDSCTKILRSAITYPAGNILTPANLTVALNGGSTVGNYASSTTEEINFISGNANHFFSAPGVSATGRFDVKVDLTSYPWLRFDWNNTNKIPTNDECIAGTLLPEMSDCGVNASFSFGTYRGHDRIIYWRERFQ